MTMSEIYCKNFDCPLCESCPRTFIPIIISGGCGKLLHIGDGVCPENWYCGVEGVAKVWHGEWADSELIYNGHHVSEEDVSDLMYADFCETGGKDGDYNALGKYIKEHPEDLKFYIEEALE